MRNKMVLLVTGVFLAIASVVISAAPLITEFTLCKDITEKTDYYVPVDTTDVFSPNDSHAYCYFSVWASKTFKATLRWYTPNGTLYQTDRTDKLQDGCTWHIVRKLEISGTSAASKLGEWRVELTIAPPVALSTAMGGFHPKILTTSFSITANTPTSAPSYFPPAVITPQPLTPTTTVRGAWKLGTYSLSITDTIKTQYFHDIAHVTLLVGFPDLHKWTLVQDVHVDTGAFKTMLPIDVAEELGIAVHAGKKIDFKGVTGNDTGWEHELTIGVILLGGGEDVDGYVLGTNSKPYLFSIPIIFYGHEHDGSASKLLGRTGVLSVLDLLFGERVLTIAIRPE